jgi:hypothetical protein
MSSAERTKKQETCVTAGWAEGGRKDGADGPQNHQRERLLLAVATV